VKRLCVFAGSSPGARGAYRQAAADLGHTLATRGITLVYGGACRGLMAVLADAALQAGGEVIGVMPQALVAKEVAHTGLSDLRVVASMHERKQLMADLADGFIALPGGLGTLEELAEMLTWAQLGLHQKPVGLVNVEGYYAPLVAFLDHAVAERFLAPAHRSLLLMADTPEPLLRLMASYRPHVMEKWLDRETS
jgi:uncharacterized protein (TIGR00730 family)